MALDFPSTLAVLAEWEGDPVVVAVDRERLRTGFKPMVALQGQLGAGEVIHEVGQEPGIQNIPAKDLPPEQRTYTHFFPVGSGEDHPVLGRPGFYVSPGEFDRARQEVGDRLIITGRDLEVQVLRLDEEAG